MRIKCLFPTVFFLMLLNSNAMAQTIVKPITQVTYLTAVSNNEISADYIQMLWGAAAVKAAKKTGEAESEVDKNGKKTWFVPNDYFIVNSSKKIRKLQLAKDVQVVLVKEMSSESGKSTLAKLKKQYKDNIFKLYISNNLVTKVEQIYVP